MMTNQLSDLDGLVEKVRDPSSRDIIAEAVIAYRAGALRSAIILCWSAVFGDLVGKIRELAQEGNNAAKQFIEEFDRNIRNPQKMLTIEQTILNKGSEQFLMFDHRDEQILLRIREDRHACAHPALAGDEGYFLPTPELVRAHLAHALERLLVRPPAQGKEALIRLWRDLDDDRFPSRWEEAVALVRDRYLVPGTETLRRNVARGAVRGLLHLEDPFNLAGHPGFAAAPPHARRRGFLACLEGVTLKNGPESTLHGTEPEHRSVTGRDGKSGSA